MDNRSGKPLTQISKDDYDNYDLNLKVSGNGAGQRSFKKNNCLVSQGQKNGFGTNWNLKQNSRWAD